MPAVPSHLSVRYFVANITIGNTSIITNSIVNNTMFQIKFYLHRRKVHLLHHLRISLVYKFAVNLAIIFISSCSSLWYTNDLHTDKGASTAYSPKLKGF